MLPTSYPPKDTETVRLIKNDAHEKCVHPEADNDGRSANTRLVPGRSLVTARTQQTFRFFGRAAGVF